MPAVQRAGRPKSLVEHLSEQAPKRAVNDIVSIDRYLISARLLLSQATEYRAIGADEQLYVILLRYASLVIETIPSHRDFKTKATAYAALKRELVERYLPELERLKTSLQLKDRAEPPVAVTRNRPTDAVLLTTSDLPQLDWASAGTPSAAAVAAAAAAAAAAPGMYGAAPGSAPAHGAVASYSVDDLLDVINGPRSMPPQAGQSYGQSQSSWSTQQPQYQASYSSGSSSGPVDPYALAASHAQGSSMDVGVLQPKYSATYTSSSSMGRHALFGATAPAGGGGGGSGGAAGRYATPRYPQFETGPVVQQQQGVGVDVPMQQLSLDPHRQGGEQQGVMLVHPSAGPSLGPQEMAVIVQSPNTHGLPDTCAPGHHGSPSAPPPPPPPTSSPPVASGGGGGGPRELTKRAQLRDVHVSVALMEEFLHYARANTGKGIESCGILAGKLLADDSIFAITTLIIPKQQGTTDTVQALNEEEIFEAQFERELYPLGWIHTHPTQTCFLSSVDVHTQCGYQTMLDEAVAIVMAPTDRSKKCGIFRLSTPGGLTLVQKCPLRGFHTHPPTDTGQELYELCGHVYLNSRTKHEVLDLR